MKARLLESREIAPAVRHFVFDVPELEAIAFTPGQFVSLHAPVHGQDITRAYSIASPPDGNRFELCLNLVDDGHLSPYLFQMRSGEMIEMQGPLGTFGFREPTRDSILVATGTGIAPFRAMLRYKLLADITHQFTLIFGVRHEYGILYRDEFEELARKHPNFRFWPSLTRPEPAWTGRTGRVQSHILEAIGDLRDFDIYLCGLRIMVDDARKMLKGIGLDRKRIVSEKYD